MRAVEVMKRDGVSGGGRLTRDARQTLLEGVKRDIAVTERLKSLRLAAI